MGWRLDQGQAMTEQHNEGLMPSAAIGTRFAQLEMQVQGILNAGYYCHECRLFQPWGAAHLCERGIVQAPARPVVGE